MAQSYASETAENHFRINVGWSICRILGFKIIFRTREWHVFFFKILFRVKLSRAAGVTSHFKQTTKINLTLAQYCLLFCMTPITKWLILIQILQLKLCSLWSRHKSSRFELPRVTGVNALRVSVGPKSWSAGIWHWELAYIKFTHCAQSSDAPKSVAVGGCSLNLAEVYKLMNNTDSSRTTATFWRLALFTKLSIAFQSKAQHSAVTIFAEDHQDSEQAVDHKGKITVSGDLISEKHGISENKKTPKSHPGKHFLCTVVIVVCPSVEAGCRLLGPSNLGIIRPPSTHQARHIYSTSPRRRSQQETEREGGKVGRAKKPNPASKQSAKTPQSAHW